MNMSHLNRIVRRLLPVQAANSGLDDSSVLLNLEDRSPGVLVNHILLDGILELRVGPLLQVVVVDGGHGHDHHAGRAVLSDVAVVDPLDEQSTLYDKKSIVSWIKKSSKSYK